MKSWNIYHIISGLAFILSVVAVCRTCPRVDLSFDYLGLIVGILSLATALLAIMFGFNVFDIKNRIKEQVDIRTSNIEDKMDELEKRTRGYSEYLSLLQSYFRHRDLSISNKSFEKDYLIVSLQNLLSAYEIGIVTKQDDIKSNVLGLFRKIEHKCINFKNEIAEMSKHSLESIRNDRGNDAKSEGICSWFDS